MTELEKKAEEYYESKPVHTYVDSLGYFHDLEGIKQAYIQGRLDERKANEWHYPSKGELPKCDEETQLIFYVNCYYEVGGETLTRKRMVLGFYKKSFINDDVKLFVEKSKGYEEEHLPKDVIAWKEIVPPKEG